MNCPRFHHCILGAVLALALVACGGGGDGVPPPPGTSVLTAPADASEFATAPAAFTWTSAGDGVEYRLVIVVLGAGQTPSSALASNPTHFETTTAALTYAVAPGAPTLTAGTAYAWHVVASRGGQETTSDPFWLRMTAAGETVSRGDAISILLHRLIVPATRERPVTAWLGRVPTPTGVEVWPWNDPGGKHTLGAVSWFAWIDDDPKAFFEHDTRFVFIDVVTGAVTVHASEWWPVVDGTSVWMDDEAWNDREVIVYSEVHEEEEEGV